jgi:hypothetical protein
MSITILLTFAGCGGSPNAIVPASTAPTVPTAVPPEIPTPEAGRIVFTGRLVSETTGQPVTDAPVWLGAIYRKDDQAIFAIDTVRSPLDYTDSNGYFIIEQIAPLEYTITIGDPFQRSKVVRDTENPDDSKVYQTTADSVFDVGVIKVEEDEITK